MRQVIYYDDGSIDSLEEKAQDKYRAPHDTERVNIDYEKDDYIPNTPHPWGHGVIREAVRTKKKALPEVYRFYPHHSVLLTKPLQLLWYGINWEISPEKWRTLLSRTLAFTNNDTGLGGDTRHADYVNNRDLDCKPPSFDFVRYCGGATFHGERYTDKVYIDYINIYKPLPTPTELLRNNHLWFYATSISPTGRIQFIMRLGIDGYLKKVRIPIYAAQPIYLPVSELHHLAKGEKIEPNIIVYR